MKSQSTKEIAVALAKAQIAFKPIKRTEKVGYDTKSGAKKYNYAPLEVVIEATKHALSDNGLAVTQSTYLTGSNIILETALLHSSGEWLSSELYVGKQDLPPQQLGSALTYMRRYAYSAILCVSSEEDDDGEQASQDKAAVTITSPTTEPSPFELHEMAQALKTGGALCSFALKHGWTIQKIQTALGIEKSSDIKDVKVAALVLFPQPVAALYKGGKDAPNPLVQEALQLGAKEI